MLRRIWERLENEIPLKQAAYQPGRSTIYNFLKNSIPTDLTKLFTLNAEIHGYQTRQDFHIPGVDTSTYGINSLKYHGPVLWNKTWTHGVPIDKDNNNIIKFNQIHSSYQFKRVMRKHYFHKYTL